MIVVFPLFSNFSWWLLSILYFNYKYTFMQMTCITICNRLVDIAILKILLIVLKSLLVPENRFWQVLVSIHDLSFQKINHALWKISDEKVWKNFIVQNGSSECLHWSEGSEILWVCHRGNPEHIVKMLYVVKNCSNCWKA